jgi:hypothetical protein
MRTAEKVSAATVALLLLVAPLTSATATSAPSCPQAQTAGWRPYGASPEVQSACGFSIYQVSSIASLPSGGSVWKYDLPGGGQAAAVEPPAGFDPLTANSAQLAEYGIPPEPPASNAVSQANWIAAFGNSTYEQPPQALLESKENFGTTQKPSNIWSGYLDTAAAGTFHYASGMWYSPTVHSPNCSGAMAAPWVGIGGWQNKDLGQAGEQLGATNYDANAPIVNGEGWFEDTGASNYNAFPVPFYGIAGDDFEVWVQYGYISWAGATGYQYTFSRANGPETSYFLRDGNYNGSTTDFVVEDPNGGTENLQALANYGTLDFQLVTTAGQENPINDYPVDDVTMYGYATGDTQAYPYGLGTNDGYTFYNQFDLCS